MKECVCRGLNILSTGGGLIAGLEQILHARDDATVRGVLVLLVHANFRGRSSALGQVAAGVVVVVVITSSHGASCEPVAVSGARETQVHVGAAVAVELGLIDIVGLQ